MQLANKIHTATGPVCYILVGGTRQLLLACFNIQVHNMSNRHARRRPLECKKLFIGLVSLPNFMNAAAAFRCYPAIWLVLFVGGGTLIVPCRKTPMPCISSRVARAEEGTRTALPLFRECAEGIGNCLGKLAKCREANIALL